MSLTSIQRDFFVKAGLTVLGTSTVSTSSGNTSTLQVEGGAAIAKNLIVGQQSDFYGTVTNYGGTLLGVTTVTTFNVTGIASFTNGTNASSTATGSLQVTGGAGIGGNLWVGGTINGTISTATNLAGGANGSLPYQTNAGQTAFIPIGVAGFILQSDGSTATWVSTSSIAFGIATTASNLQFGGQYQIPYQTGPGQTAFEAGFEYNYTSNTFSVDNTIINASTNATSTATGSLQVRGGVGINRNLFVGEDVKIAGDLAIAGGDLETSQTTFNLLNTTATTINFGGAGTTITVGANGSGSTTIRNKFTVTDTTNASSTTTGALQVIGGAGIQQDVFIGGKVVIEKTDASTGTITANALYVAGGVGIAKSLFVTGPATFNDSVIFAGTSTYVYSTNTVYTDNLLNLHVPSGSTGTNHSWAVDDGKDIGHVFHYYDTTDKDAFLGIANDSKWLEWYDNGTESGGIFTGTSYGIFKTGGIRLVHTTASSTTATGALTVAGGVGIGGAINIGGTANVTGRSTLGEVTAGSTTATTFNATGISRFTDTTNAVATNDGAVRISGGISVVKDIYAGGVITAGATQAASSGTTVSGVFYNNTLLASYTSNAITTVAQQNLDSFSAAAYRSARYYAQVTMGSSIHVSEISVMHDGTKAYISEYGILTNNGQLGVYDATYSGGNVTLVWTANTTTSHVIKLSRLTLSV